MPKILLYETEQELAQRIRSWFIAEGCIVDVARSKQDVLRFLHPGKYDIIVIDYPESDQVSEFYKKLLMLGGDAPILLLPVNGSVSRDRFIKVLDAYLSKLFNQVQGMPVSEPHKLPAAGSAAHILKAGGIELNTQFKRAVVNGKDVELTPLEFDLLETLMRHSNAVITLEQFNSRKDCLRYCVSNAALRTCMKTLRRKIGDDGRASTIHTVHGLGYRLVVA